MNPMTYVMIGVVVFLLTNTLNRFLGERNYGGLSPEEKLKLTGAFSKHRSLGTYIPVAIILAMILVSFFNPLYFFYVAPVGILLIVVTAIVLQSAVLRRLRELSLPADYVKKFRTQSMLVQTGQILAYALYVAGIVKVLV